MISDWRKLHADIENQLLVYTVCSNTTVRWKCICHQSQKILIFEPRTQWKKKRTEAALRQSSQLHAMNCPSVQDNSAPSLTNKHTFGDHSGPLLQGFLHCVVINCSNVSKERTLPIVRVTELVQCWNAMEENVSVTQQFEQIWPIRAKDWDGTYLHNVRADNYYAVHKLKDKHHWKSFGCYQLPAFFQFCIKPIGLYNGEYVFCE
jgi:hypothetical protein